MRLMGVLVLALAVVLAGCGGKRGAPREVLVPVSAPATTATKTCLPPAQMAVTQVSSGDARRLLVVQTASGEVVWQGPPYSGISPAAWSFDGKRLAYAAGGDVIIHEDGRADRLVFRGHTEGESFAFSRSGRWLAVVADDKLVAVDLLRLDADPRAQLEAVEADGRCAPSSIRWAPGSERLASLCDTEAGLGVWDASTGTLAPHPVRDVSKLLGWWPGDDDALVVERQDNAVWRLPLEGEPSILFEDRISESGLAPTNVVAETGLATFSDYDEDEGYARTVWLARQGGPSVAWLDGVISDLSFSVGGAWASFVTASDSTDEAGDVYLVRVGRPEVRRVLEAPAEAYSELIGSDPDDDDPTAREEPAETVFDLGFREPLLRPQPAVPCAHAMPAARQELQLAMSFASGSDVVLQRGGVVLDDRADSPVLLIAGDRPVALDESVGWQAVARLGNGVILALSDAGDTLWLSPQGDEITRISAVQSAVNDAVGLAGGGIVFRLSPTSLELRDLRGALAGSVVHPKGIEEIRPRGDGLLLLTADRAVAVDARGRALGSFAAQDAVALLGLTNGDIAVIKVSVELDSERPQVQITVRSPQGAVKHRSQLELSVSGSTTEPELSHVLALPDGGFVIVAGEERVKAGFFDRRGRPRGWFKLGLIAENAPTVMSDGTVVFVGPGERDLLLVDSQGELVGGIALQGLITLGPFAVGPDRIVVETELGLRVFQRHKRR